MPALPFVVSVTLAFHAVAVCRSTKTIMDYMLSWIDDHRMRWIRRLGVGALLLASVCGQSLRASVALLMEEPFGEFGAINPTGHAAIYLNRVCAETPTQLRLCKPGEYGVVISRYHKIAGYDWIAIPLVPYLYAVDNVKDVPDAMNLQAEAALRDAYRRKHLMELAPDDKRGAVPKGEWIQLIGASYDRRIHGFQVATTLDEDERFISLFNDKRNVSQFNLFFHNCADFSKTVLDTYFPHSVHRNFIADVGITTPKQVARSLVKYGKKHPELEMSEFVIPQVSGSIKRSHSVDGVAESLVKSKKYLLPLAVLNPELTAGVIVAYLADGRMSMPKHARVFNLQQERTARRSPTDVALEDGGGITSTSTVAPYESSRSR